MRTLPSSRGLGDVGRIRPAQLQGDGLFCWIKADEIITITEDHGLVDRHLGIEQCMPGQDTVKGPAMPVGPVHHRGDGKPSVYTLYTRHRRHITQSGRKANAWAPVGSVIPGADGLRRRDHRIFHRDELKAEYTLCLGAGNSEIPADIRHDLLEISHKQGQHTQ